MIPFTTKLSAVALILALACQIGWNVGGGWVRTAEPTGNTVRLNPTGDNEPVETVTLEKVGRGWPVPAYRSVQDYRAEKLTVEEVLLDEPLKVDAASEKRGALGGGGWKLDHNMNAVANIGIGLLTLAALAANLATMYAFRKAKARHPNADALLLLDTLGRK